MINKILIVLAFATTLFAQYIPQNFSLNQKGNNLSKIISAQADTPASNSIQDIIAEDDLIIIGTSRGVSISDDDGETWKNFYQTEPFGTDGATAIGYNNGVIWVTTGRTTEVEGGSLMPEGTGIKYSSDNGNTWNALPQPTDEQGDSIITYGINSIRALPVTTTISNISYDIAFTKNTIWIASFAGGLRKSSDMGETWERVVLPPDTLDSISPNDTLNFSLQPVAGKFGPESWLNHRVFSVMGVDDSTLYVGTAGGINKSTDNGITWKKFTHKNQSNAISGNFVVALGENKLDKSIWAATWKAEDLDEYWGVSYSFDGGENWDVTLSDEHAHNFGFKYLDDSNSNVFVPTDRGIFRSSNNGGTWMQPSSIMDSYTNVPIATNIFYAATSKKLNATDFHIWVGSNNGLARLTETNGFWEGDWKVYLASSDIKEDETYAFPNPFSPALELVKIKYTLHEEGKVTIRIMNFGMELVRVLAQNAQRGRGDLFDFWDGKDETGEVVKNGVYFYRIDSDVLSKSLFGKIMVLK